MKLPVIIMLALIPLVLTAYAEAPSHVDVYDYPFNITLLEGGNFTLYNNGTNNIYFDGSFSGMVYCGSISGNPDCDGFDNSKTFELPANIFNAPNTYYLKDKTISGSTLVSTIKIENPTPVYVAPPTPTYNPPTPQPTPQPIEESIFGEPTLPEVTGVHTWCNSPCSDDVVIVVNSTSTSTHTNIFNNTITELKAEIKSLKEDRDNWKSLAEALMKLFDI